MVTEERYGIPTHLMYYFKYLDVRAENLSISIIEDREFDVYARLPIPLQQ